MRLQSIDGIGCKKRYGQNRLRLFSFGLRLQLSQSTVDDESAQRFSFDVITLLAERDV